MKIEKLCIPGGVPLKDPATIVKITTAISKNVLFRFVLIPSLVSRLDNLFMNKPNFALVLNMKLHLKLPVNINF